MQNMTSALDEPTLQEVQQREVDRPDTLPDSSTELLEAIEWLRERGVIKNLASTDQGAFARFFDESGADR